MKSFIRQSDRIFQLKNDFSNLTTNIVNKTDCQLYEIPRHPICTLRNKIREFYSTNCVKSDLQNFLRKNHYLFNTHSNPVVSKFQNFDSLLIQQDHVSRQKSDTFYINEEMLLRTHTSAHQNQFMKTNDQFCVLADVYRKDEIDKTHYPVFHQMEGVSMYTFEEIKSFKKIFKNNLPIDEVVQNEKYEYYPQLSKEENINNISIVVQDMKQTHENLIRYLLGNPNIKVRWIRDYFPFTEPSYEMQVYFENTKEWIEILGCGIIHKNVIDQTGVKDSKHFIGWASGIGIERLAMLLYKIPDIRLFWSEDERFLSQFQENKISKFHSFSKYPECRKDISFYINDNFEMNDFYEIVREVGGDFVEKVEKTDEYFNKKVGKKSLTFKISYRSLERTLLNEEIDVLQFQLRDLVADKLNLELRQLILILGSKI